MGFCKLRCARTSCLLHFSHSSSRLFFAISYTAAKNILPFCTLKPFITKKKKKKKIGQNLDFPIKLPGMIIPKSKVYSELQQCKSFNPDLLTRIIQLESNTVTNSQYSRRETIELNPVPAEIHEGILEESICKALSLTGVNVVPENL